MVYQASYVWVTNPELYGGPITDHVYIVDPASDRIVDSVKFSRNPTAIESDMEGNLWVLCAGSPIDGDSARLFKYDPDTRDVLDFWSLPASFTAKLAISAATGEVAAQVHEADAGLVDEARAERIGVALALPQERQHGSRHRSCGNGGQGRGLHPLPDEAGRFGALGSEPQTSLGDL